MILPSTQNFQLPYPNKKIILVFNILKLSLRKLTHTFK